MGGGHRKGADLFVLELAPNLLQVFRLDQHAFNDLHHRMAGLGDGHQPLALAYEDFDAEFVLEFTDLLGDTRLGGKQPVRRLGQVQSPTDGFAHVSKLLKVHITVI